MKSLYIKLARYFESGFATQIQALAYTMALTTMIAFLFDMSNVALGITIGRTALTAAAQDAAKLISPVEFVSSQVVLLDQDSVRSHAQSVASTIGKGRVQVDSVQTTSNGIQISGRVRVLTPSMGALLGINGYEIPLTITAAPSFGIEHEGTE